MGGRHSRSRRIPRIEEWAALFYFCGRASNERRDPFDAAVQALEAEARQSSLLAGVYRDGPAGARHGVLDPDGTRWTAAAPNSGSPNTLEQFLTWAFEECPARHYILTLGGPDATGPAAPPEGPADIGRAFAVCHDPDADAALDVGELAAVLGRVFRTGHGRRLALLVLDTRALQYFEVAYELQHSADFMVGVQPTRCPDVEISPPGRYRELLTAWGAETGSRRRSSRQGLGARLATASVASLARTSGRPGGARSVISAVNLRALGSLAETFDTFSAVYLQWLGNEVLWDARTRVVGRLAAELAVSASYDLGEVARVVSESLRQEARDGMARWAARRLPQLDATRLVRTLRVLALAIAETSGADGASPELDELAGRLALVRERAERLDTGTAVGGDRTTVPVGEPGGGPGGLFVDGEPSTGEAIRPVAWTRIWERARERLDAALSAEIGHTLKGCGVAGQLAAVADRVGVVLAERHPSGLSPVIAVEPGGAGSGLSLYRPLTLDLLSDSNYLDLRFSRELHWTALLTGINLIENHPRTLWRLVESQLIAAPAAARYEVMRRLAGDGAITGRFANNLAALSAPTALVLAVEPDTCPEGDETGPDGAGRGENARRAADRDTPARGSMGRIGHYTVRLSSVVRSATILERKNPVNLDRLDAVLRAIDSAGDDPEAEPDALARRLARYGSVMGDDLLFGLGERLEKEWRAQMDVTPGRLPHLVLQLPRELMRYPWELLCHRWGRSGEPPGWLIDRFALSRQIVWTDEGPSRWPPARQQGPLRLLVVAPETPGVDRALADIGVGEGRRVAASFARLEERLPGLVAPADFERHVGRTVTVGDFRSLVRDGRFDVIHFAGHGRYDAARPERSALLLSDGPLYAFELRHTLASAMTPPWLLYANACEAARERGASAAHRYHDGVYGLASAALGQGVAAYVGPLWRIVDADAVRLAEVFYHALLLRRLSLGEALAVARKLVKSGADEEDPALLLPLGEPAEPEVSGQAKTTGWAGMALYGDPTPTILQRLSPADVEAGEGS